VKELLIEYLPANASQIARVRVAYRASLNSQLQSRESDFTFEYAAADRDLICWYLEDYLECPWDTFNDRAAQAEATMERIGAELFRAVFGSEETGRQYYRVADELAQTRIIIHAADPAGVAIPWELLRDPQKPYGYLACQADAFVRSQTDLTYEPPALPQNESFNILLVISRPSGENDIPFQSIARPLLELCRPYRDRIQIDVLRPPTFEQLQKVLDDRPNFYHVLHFDGHGAFPQGSAEQGVLAFEGENTPSRVVRGEELGGLLAGKNVPLVVLDACQSGMTRTEAIYTSVGNQLLQAGVGGVIAMAYSVYVESSVRFFARLYERLMAGDEVACAVRAGREALRNHPGRFSPIGELPLRDWIVPVLFESARLHVVATPVTGVHLNLAAQQGQQRQAGTEIGCPETPAFGFVGRDDAILRLERAFEKEAIVLLKGIAGIGKTETAVGFARWRAETGALGGSVFFFRFEHFTPLALVCDEIGNAFQPFIKQQLGVEWAFLDAKQRRGVAVQLLQKVPCFLIWDNFEPVHGFPVGTISDWTVDEQDELRRFLSDLSCGATKILLTGRRDEPWLGPIYRSVELGGLRLPDAQELSVRVLQRAGLNADQIKALPDYNELLTYLRGNPLAIQTILPELARRAPTALLTDLQSGEVNLPDDFTQSRERSLSASLNYRVEELDPAVRQRLGVIGLFQGFGNTHVLTAISEQRDAPEFIRDLAWSDWNGILRQAADIGLLHDLGSGRYTLHPALPSFFAGLLQKTSSDNVNWFERSFCKACCGVGHGLQEMFQIHPSVALFQLSFEEPNLKYALRLCEKHGLWSSAIGVLDGLNILLPHQGRWSEWEKLVTSIKTKVTDSSAETLQEADFLWPALLGYQSRIAEYRHNFHEKIEIDLQLADHFKRLGDESGYATSLQHQGISAEGIGRFDEAKQLYLESANIHQRLKDEHAYAEVLGQLAALAFNLGNLTESESLIQQILPIFRRFGNRPREAECLYNLGNIFLKQSKLDEADQEYVASLTIARNLGFKEAEANALHHLGVLALQRHQYDIAEQRYRASLIIAEEMGNKRLLTTILHNLGKLAELRGNKDEAGRFYQQSRSISGNTN